MYATVHDDVKNKIMSKAIDLIRLEHDHIVKCFDLFVMKDFLYVVTEYCEVY